jgi:hypothetical protein
MAATRNKNTPGDYELELKGKIMQADYKVYEPYAAPEQTTWAGDGLLAGKVGPMKLSSNYCDIETYLRGIGSTNLVTPKPDIVPQLNTLQSLNVIDRLPVQVPAPYIHSKQERPFRGGN